MAAFPFGPPSAPRRVRVQSASAAGAASVDPALARGSRRRPRERRAWRAGSSGRLEIPFADETELEELAERSSASRRSYSAISIPSPAASTSAD
jgi:hypothetical protein